MAQDPALDLTPVYEDAGKRYGIDPDFLRAQDEVESRNNDIAISPAGAQGRAQFMPSTARQMGLHDPFDPREAIPAQAQLIRQNYDRSGSMAQAVAEYHGGTDPRNWGARTHAYVNDVTNTYMRHRQQKEAPPAFDSSKPFEMEGAKPPPFDPSKPYETPGPAFDASKPFETEGLPLTNAQAVKQLPMAEKDEGTAPPQIPVGNGADLANVLASPEAQAADIPQSQTTNEAAGRVAQSIKDAWQSSPALLTPKAQEWLDKTGLGGIARLADIAIAAPNAVFAGAQQTAVETARSIGGERMARGVGELTDYAMTGAPELTMGPHAHREAMPAEAGETPVTPGGPARVTPEPQTAPQTLAQHSPTPTLDAVASEARARAPQEPPAPNELHVYANRPQTPEQAALDELHQEAVSSPEAQPGSALEALKQHAVAETEPKVAAAPAEVVTPPPAPLADEAQASLAGAPKVAEPPDVRQRLAEVSAAEAERSKAEEAAPPRGAPTPFEPEPQEPQRLTSYLRSLGGVNDEGGDVRSTLGGAKYRPGLINKTGLPMDEAALRAWQAGYFPEFGDERPSINDLREALDDDLKYRPRYSMYDDAAVANYENTKFRNSEVDRLASQYGIDTNGKTRDQFFTELNAQTDQSFGSTLYSFPGALGDPEAWRRAFGPLAPAMQKLRDLTGPKIQSATDWLFPMTGGTTRSQAMVADFANRLRGPQYRFAQIDKELEKGFPRETRDAMGRALDAQSVFEQQVRDLPADQQIATREEFDRAGTGLAGLPERQRQVLEGLDAISQDAWRQMQEREMVPRNARAIPYYMPRQILMWSEENGFTRPSSGRASASIGIDARGANLTTNGPMRREHLTPEETEAAAQAKLGEGAQLLRDVRSLPSRLAYTYRAIAGVDLMRDIEDVGRLAGVNLVVRGDIPGLINPGDYFTMSDHPSFRKWTGTGWQAVHVAKEFEGPLKAVLSKQSGELYQAAMKLKGGMMKTIMYSPFQHLNVEIGRAFPMMRHEIVSVFKDGNRVRKDLNYMDQATRDGVAPLGQRGGWENDPVSIADATREPAQQGPIRSALGAAGHAVDTLHQRILWDQVFNLQMGIYDNLKRKWTGDGPGQFPERVAGIMAAHEANRYAGALPPENLARGANMAANLLLFSRSFTLGNLGVIKDMFNGAPSHTRALIEHEFGPEMAKNAQAAMRRKAQAAFTLDIGIQYLGTALAQTAWRAGQLAAIAGGASYIAPAAQQALGEWYDQAVNAISQARVNPLEAFGIFPQHSNEPGKQDRAYLGVDPQSNRGVYARLMFGKIGEEFMGWFTRPSELLLNKLNVGVRAGMEDIFGEDAYGKLISKPYPRTIFDYIDKAGAYVQHIGGTLGPISTAEGVIELGRHYIGGEQGKDSPATAWAKVLLPTAGLGQISEGYPGGPAAGEIHAQSKRTEYDIQQALPGIRKKIKAGDAEGAVADMTKLGIPPGLQRYYLRQTTNPQPSKRQLQNFQRTAPPEVMERYQRQLPQ